MLIKPGRMRHRVDSGCVGRTHALTTKMVTEKIEAVLNVSHLRFVGMFGEGELHKNLIHRADRPPDLPARLGQHHPVIHVPPVEQPPVSQNLVQRLYSRKRGRYPWHPVLGSSPPSGAAEPRYRIRLFGEHCLSGASCAAIQFGAGAEFTRRAAHGRKWFWILLPKQKDLRVECGRETP